MAGKTAIAGIIIVIIALIAAAWYLTSAPSYSTSSQVALQLTDPPQVPSGAQALTIDYSALQVHLANAGNVSGWMQASGVGSVNLLELLNLSQTIGTAVIPANATINLVRFNITSASIEINGTTYNVTVPSGQITASINGGAAMGSNSSILLEMSPVVASIITNTSTVFVLVPSLRGVIVPGASNSTTLQLGNRARLGYEARAELNGTMPNITITSASLAVLPGNVTDLSVTVKNNGNQSVVVKHIALSGSENVRLNASALGNGAASMAEGMATHIGNLCLQLNRSSGFNVSEVINESEHIGANIIGMGNMGAGIRSEPELNGSGLGSIYLNASAAGMSDLGAGIMANIGAEIENESLNVAGRYGILLNASACNNTNATAIASRVGDAFVNMTQRFQEQQSNFRFVVFSVQSNGTLAIPSSEGEFSNPGMSIGAGQSSTLQFSGVMSMAGGRIVLVPVNGTAYGISVQGEEAASASANVTATAG